MIRKILRRVRAKLLPGRVSAGYAVIDEAQARSLRADGWRDEKVARRQDKAFSGLLEEMRRGRPRRDLELSGRVIRDLGVPSLSLLEVGCGSGYTREVIDRLSEAEVDYAGTDYSAAMIGLARTRCSGCPLVVSDGARLPFRDGAFDVVFNGVSLMHILDYGGAIREARRVARRWCVFHIVPVLQEGETRILSKTAYGEPTVEIVFSEPALRTLLDRSGLEVLEAHTGIEYDLSAVLGQSTTTKTFVCRVRGAE